MFDLRLTHQDPTYTQEIIVLLTRRAPMTQVATDPFRKFKFIHFNIELFLQNADRQLHRLFPVISLLVIISLNEFEAMKLMKVYIAQFN